MESPALSAIQSSGGRSAEIVRKTRETEIKLSLNLDGGGKSETRTGVGFLDHMLELFSRHSLMDLAVECSGDLQVDAHHTTEDVGICLGQAFDRALGDRSGIRRYGHAILPMDETLVTCAVDLGGRPFWVWNAPMPTPRVGDFDSELVADFWQAFTVRYSLATYGSLPNQSIATLNHMSAEGALLYIAAFVALFGLYALAMRRGLLGGTRLQWLLVIGFAVIMNIALLRMDPTDAADIYDYIIRGRMSAVYGLNPLHDTPNAVSLDPFYPLVGWKNVASAYGPAWEVIASTTRDRKSVV